MYKRNCAKSRKKLGGVYLLGGSHRSVGSDACIRPRGCTSLPDCTGGYGIRPYGHVGEHSICSRGSMQASTPTGKSVAKSHPSPPGGGALTRPGPSVAARHLPTLWGVTPQGEPYGARHLEAPLEGSWRRRRLRGGPVAVIYGITKNRPARLGAGR